MAHRLTVFGTGYLGAAHAAGLAELGFEVLGVDTRPEQVRALSAGQLPFYEPGLEVLLRRGLNSGRLAFTTSYERAADFGDIHFICVGTPQLDGSGKADLSQITACADTLAPLLRRPCLVVGKSTVPVGTAGMLADRLARRAPAGPGAELAWNPEFLREGHAVADTLRPDRIVIGVRSARAEAALREVYAGPLADGTPLIVTDFPTAELVKVAANSFLATKISFINAMAEVCEAAGADVVPLARALGYDDRIGAKFLGAGLGFGGGCLPKDIRSFGSRAAELGAGQALRFLREIDAINLRRRIRAVDLAAELAGGSLRDASVCVLGAAFKPGSDDTRDSPALDVAAMLHGEGARVTVCDPVASDRAQRERPEFRHSDSLRQAAAGADVLLLATEWPQFAEADPHALAGVVAWRNIVDARNALDPGRWIAAGWAYRALGRPLAGRPLSWAGDRQPQSAAVPAGEAAGQAATVP